MIHNMMIKCDSILLMDDLSVKQCSLSLQSLHALILLPVGQQNLLCHLFSLGYQVAPT